MPAEGAGVIVRIFIARSTVALVLAVGKLVEPIDFVLVLTMLKESCSLNKIHLGSKQQKPENNLLVTKTAF